jgi:hypothetical protein
VLADPTHSSCADALSPTRTSTAGPSARRPCSGTPGTSSRTIASSDPRARSALARSTTQASKPSGAGIRSPWAQGKASTSRNGAAVGRLLRGETRGGRRVTGSVHPDDDRPVTGHGRRHHCVDSPAGRVASVSAAAISAAQLRTASQSRKSPTGARIAVTTARSGALSRVGSSRPGNTRWPRGWSSPVVVAVS